MSAVTSQPLPFDQLERERHIQMIFRAFRSCCGPTCQCNTHSSGHKLNQIPPDWESDEQSGPGPRKMANMPLPRNVSLLEVEEQWPGGAAGSNFMSVLEKVQKINIIARPELQGELPTGFCLS